MAMKANELRVGNWVSIRVGHPFRFELPDFADWYYDYNSHEYGDHIHPVPITEEWLMEFAFDSKSPCKDFEDCGMPYYAKHGVLLFYNGNRLKHELSDYLIGYGSMRSGKYHIATIRWIKYVHQLQNLYFALTGEELTTIKQ